MKRILACLIGLMSYSHIASAATDIFDIDQLSTLADPQGAFKSLSEDVGAAISYRASSPAEHLGITGFDIGVDINVITVGNSKDWLVATSDNKEIDTFVLPKLHVHKGLPFGIDVGAFYAGSGNTDLELIGAELKYALLKGGVAKPAIALRATYSQLNGIDQLDMETTGVELAISKGFAMFTPYGGVGKIWIDSTPKKEAAAPPANLESEDFSLNKVFVGLNINLALFNIGLEGDRTGEATAYNLKLGFRW